MSRVPVRPPPLTRPTPISIREVLAPYPDDDAFQELWDECYELYWVSVGRSPQTEDRRLFKKLNVREIYRLHKAAGYPQHFARFILDALDLVEEEDFDLSEEEQLCERENWFKRNGVLLFRQIGPWTYDEYCDDYSPPLGPLVRGSLSYFG